ncbi:MAG: BREX system ATP-binding domain-containing protein [Pseudomonadota bacterium]
MESSSTRDVGLSSTRAREILESLAEFGIPPRSGTEQFSEGFEPIVAALRTRYLDDLLREGRSCFKVVEARYGGGKTHFLYTVKDAALDAGFAVSLVDMRPQECAFDRPLGIYRAVARSITLPDHQDQGLERLLRDRLGAQPGGVRELEAWLDVIVRHLPMESASFRAAVHGYLRALLKEETASAEILGAYLLGEPVPAAALRPFGVYERMTHGNALQMLRCLCVLVRQLGFGGLVVLVDEVDRLLTSRRMTRAAEAMVDTLRDLVDLVGRNELPGAMFLVAVPGREFWELVERYQALSERLRSPYPFAPSTPLTPVIHLDRLPMPEEELLIAIGRRLCRLRDAIYGDGAATEENVERLAELCLGRRTERGNRRLFVRSAALLLTDAAGDPTRPMEESALSAVLSSSLGAT